MKISDLLLQIQNPDAPGGKDFKENSKNAFRTYFKFNATNGADVEHQVQDLYARVREWVAWLELHFCQRTILNYVGHVKKALEVLPQLRDTISDTDEKIDLLSGEMRRIKATSGGNNSGKAPATTIAEDEVDQEDEDEKSESNSESESESDNDDEEDPQEPLEDIRDELISIGTTLAQVVADKDTMIEALTADLQDLQEQVRSQRARIENIASLAGIFRKLADVFDDNSPAKASYIVMLEAMVSELKV